MNTVKKLLENMLIGGILGSLMIICLAGGYAKLTDDGSPKFSREQLVIVTQLMEINTQLKNEQAAHLLRGEKQAELDKIAEIKLNRLETEIFNLKAEVLRGISLIPSNIKVDVPVQDSQKTAIIRVINDKVDVLTSNGATKEDLEKMKADVVRVIEEGKANAAAIQAEEKKKEPVQPQVVLPQLSEEFPKK